jgi:hypothetical protein
MEPGTVTRDFDKESPSAPCSKKRAIASLPGVQKSSIIAKYSRSRGLAFLVSAADKKRNKLGYHCMAIACGNV